MLSSLILILLTLMVISMPRFSLPLPCCADAIFIRCRATLLFRCFITQRAPLFSPQRLRAATLMLMLPRYAIEMTIMAIAVFAITHDYAHFAYFCRYRRYRCAMPHDAFIDLRLRLRRYHISRPLRFTLRYRHHSRHYHLFTPYALLMRASCWRRRHRY